MKSLDFGGHVLGSLVAVAFLAGCGGSQPPIGAGTMRQSRAIAPHAAHDKSWMLAEAKSKDLLYVSDGENFVKVFTYPNGEPVGSLDVPYPRNSCSDRHGNVYISNQQQLLEYAHGGTSPVATFTIDPPGNIGTCAVDKLTGNLAVPVDSYVAIFAGGNPSQEADVNDPSLSSYQSCVYDDDGNLLIEGETTGSLRFALAKLPRGSAAFEDLAISGYAGGHYLQWDGKYVTTFGSGGPYIYQLQISGSSAIVVGTVPLKGKVSRAQPWLQGKTFAASTHIGRRLIPKGIAIWSYPEGGKPIARIPWREVVHNRSLIAMTVSVAPHQ